MIQLDLIPKPDTRPEMLTNICCEWLLERHAHHRRFNDVGPYPREEERAERVSWVHRHIVEMFNTNQLQMIDYTKVFEFLRESTK